MSATIKAGSEGPDVSKWQDLLTAAGFPTTATGVFDAQTLTQTKAWQASKGLVADGIVGPVSWGAMTGEAQAGKTDPHAAEDRAAIVEAWPGVTGETPTLPELQIVQANGKLESGGGRASYKLLDHATGQVLATSGTIWNVGAVQGGNPADGTGFLATDTSPLKVTADNPHGYYDHSYRVFPNAAAGWAEMIRQMTVRRPASWALMKAGDIDAWAEQMHAAPGKKDPISGVPGYFEQAPSSRAKGIASHIADAAFTLNEPIAATRGGPPPPGGVASTPDAGSGASVSGGVKLGALVLGLGGLGLAAFRLWKGAWPAWLPIPF